MFQSSASPLDGVVQTKILAPVLIQDLVPRPDLAQKLDVGLTGKLTLVSAPAGYGKTTQILQWLAQKNEIDFAWLSLDPGDDDPARFLVYFAAALQKVDISIGSPGLPPTPAESASLLRSRIKALLNEIIDRSSPLVLVIDDYHLIEDTAIHEAITFLVERMPPTMHLILISRSDPPLPLSRWRVRDQISEIGRADLRFAQDSVEAFLSTRLARPLSPAQMVRLVERTEGWIAGLQLAALSLRRGADPEQFLEGFSGDDRLILDYLSSEVLATLPPHQSEFLLKTSVLRRLSADLCDAVTEKSDSRRLLDELEEANLFLTALDNRRRWYRYHQLFADFLRTRLLEQAQPEAVTSLHRRASVWYQENGDLIEAVEHGLEGEDWERVADLIEEMANGLMYQSGAVSTLVRWLNRLPDSILMARPGLLTIRAWNYLWSTDFDSAEADLKRISLHRSKEPFDGQLATLRAQLASQRGEPERAISYARTALARLQDGEHRLRGMALAAMGGAYRDRGELTGARSAFSAAHAAFQQDELIVPCLIALAEEAKVLNAQGRLTESELRLQRGFRLAASQSGEQLPAVGALHIAMGDLLWLRYDRPAAADHFRQGIEFCQAWNGFAEETLMGLLGLVQVERSLAREAAEQKQLKAAETLVETFGIPRWRSALALHTALCLLEDAELKAASDLLERMPARLPSVAQDDQRQLLLARLALARRDGEDALTLLGEKPFEAEESGRVILSVQMLIVSALAQDLLARPRRARSELTRALVLSERGGIVQPFASYGPELRRLIMQTIPALDGAALVHAGVVADLLATERETISSPAGSQSLHEALTPRQLEVLKLIAAGFSNQEIAETLVVAVSTVKRHINHIYAKLGVDSRTRAIARARDLRLV